ncbi:MAG: MFS transporter [Rhizobacter sp.]|nr:MFS transporter [Rhizobacter sp.]
MQETSLGPAPQPIDGRSRADAHPGVLGWYHELGARERRTFWACFSGWSLDSMDVNLYSFVIPTLIGLWGMTRGDAGMLATAALLASALGGWLTGIIADRVGRVRALQITILWFAIFTAASALTNSYWQLLVVRVLQGFGFGGEWAAGALLIGEIIRDKHRGKGSGVVHSGWAVGWGAAALLYTVIFSLAPPELAWRVLFAFGLIPAALVFFLRRLVEEPPVFVEIQRRYAQGGLRRRSSLEIFAPGMLRVTVLASLLVIGTQGGFYAVMTWLPTYLKTVRHLSVLNTGGYLMVVIVASFIGYVVSAYVTDAIGRKRTFYVFSVLSVLTVLVYTFVPISDAAMLFLGFPLGFFASGIYSPIGAFLNELYPTSIRGSGVGFCFNVGRAVGALFPALVGSLSAVIPLGEAIGAFAVCAYGLIVIAALLLPETVGRALHSEASHAA